MNYTELDWRWAMLLGVALRDGLLEAVAEKPKTAARVAQDLEMDGRAVFVVLSALAELGVLEETDAGYAVREEHRVPLLDETSEDYVGRSVVHRFELMQGWARLPEILRTGEPVEDRTAPDFVGTETFIAAMRRGAVAGADAVAGAVLSRLPQGASILDVGGGPGTNAEAFAAGGARVTVFDRPEVIRLMQPRFSALGIATTSGDMNVSLPDGPFDCLYFGNTSHMYGPEENRALLERMRAPLAPGGLLVIREFVRGLSDDAALFAANMLVLTPRGGTHTAGEYEAWLREAGFQDIAFERVPGRGTHLVFARKPR